MSPVLYQLSYPDASARFVYLRYTWARYLTAMVSGSQAHLQSLPPRAPKTKIYPTRLTIEIQYNKLTKFACIAFVFPFPAFPYPKQRSEGTPGGRRAEGETKFQQEFTACPEERCLKKLLRRPELHRQSPGYEPGELLFLYPAINYKAPVTQ